MRGNLVGRRMSSRGGEGEEIYLLFVDDTFIFPEPNEGSVDSFMLGAHVV